MSERPKSRTEIALEDETIKQQLAQAIGACASIGCRLPYTTAHKGCPLYTELAPDLHSTRELTPEQAAENARRILPLAVSCQTGRPNYLADQERRAH